MPQQYKVEALRTIRSLQAQHERAGHDAQAEQMKRIGDQVEAIVAELAALKDAARPIAKFWKGGGVRGVVRGTNPPLEEKYLDALAALIGPRARSEQ